MDGAELRPAGLGGLRCPPRREGFSLHELLISAVALGVVLIFLGVLVLAGHGLYMHLTRPVPTTEVQVETVGLQDEVRELRRELKGVKEELKLLRQGRKW